MITVFIHGLGLIGGSLIRAIRVSHPQDQIIASDPNQAALDYALQVGLVDETTTGLAGAQRADFIILAGPQKPNLNSHGDHRLGMLAAVAALRSTTPLFLIDPDAVAVSYPSFFADLAKLGGA